MQCEGATNEGQGSVLSSSLEVAIFWTGTIGFSIEVKMIKIGVLGSKNLLPQKLVGQGLPAKIRV